MRVSLMLKGVLTACAVLLGTFAALHGQEKGSGGDLEQQRADLIADLGVAAQLAAFGNGELNAQSGLPKDFRSPEALAAAGTMLLRAHKLTGGQQTPAGEVTEDGKAVAATGNRARKPEKRRTPRRRRPALYQPHGAIRQKARNSNRL